MTTRRAFLAGSTASLAATTLPHAAQSQSGAPTPLTALFDRLMQAQLRRSPESATSLGLDTGANADLRAKLSDQSPAGVAANRAAAKAELAQLQAVDRTALTPAERIDLDCVLYTRQSAVRIGQFDFGGQAYGPSPYVVSQQAGVYQSVPTFLDTRHTVAGAGDADAYLQRMAAFARQLDDQTGRMKREAAARVVPPDFILDLALAQMTALRTPATQAQVVTSFAGKVAANGLPDRYAAQAAQLWDAQILPALDRQIAQAKAMRAVATHDAGVWKLPQGAAFYPAALQATTTTSLSPEEVHRFGLDQARAIGARLDAELRKLGYTQGTPGARMAALGRDPKYLFANDDRGRAAAIAFCNERLAAIRGKLPSVFERLPTYEFEVRRVPPQTEAGSAAAYAQPPSLDGKRPGLVYFNLRDVGDWPRFALTTTTYHEGLPGHQMEGGLALSNTRLPLIRKTGGFSGYGEGWALYAEQLADEIGMYDDDPLGRCGYLVAQLFRANRCVVDTGLHHYRWSREKAVAYFVEQQGDTESDAGREIDRYCVNPGQAASYKLGHSVFTDIRERAKAKQGARFDLKAYHSAMLANGRVPLDVLRRIGEDWIASV